VKKAKEDKRIRRKAREAIRAAWLSGATEERIVEDAADELGISRSIARQELARVEREHDHKELSPKKLRAILYQGVAIASELGDVRALIAAVRAIDKLDSTSTREQASRAKIVDLASLAAAVQRGDLDPYQAQAMRPLIELAQGTGKKVEEDADRFAEMTIEELGALYADRIGGRR